MPPKKKKGDKKGGAGIIDGVDTTQMTREQLEVFALRIKEENEREREERNFFQMERDKIRTFWEITRTELDEIKAKLRNKDRQIEEAAEANEEEIKFFKQKVKHLQYEHQLALTEAKAEAMVSLKLVQDDHTEQEKELLRDKRELKGQVRNNETENQDQVKALKLQFSEEIHNAREEFMQQAKELEMKYEKRFVNLKEELGIKHKMEMSEVEERKNAQIDQLTANHEANFNDMKNYYNDITLNNLALISSLKDQMEMLRKQNERMSKQVADLTAENKKLTEPLKKALDDVKEYERQLQNYEKDKISLANTKLKLAQTQKDFDELRWHNEALELRFEKLEAENDELNGRFVTGILELQQKVAFKNAALQKRIVTLESTVATNEAVISEITAPKKMTSGFTEKLDKMLRQKDNKISELQYELARISKAHDDLVDTYEEKLVQYGVPKNELGFVPLRVVAEGQSAEAQGPAGLVTKNP